MHTLRAKFKNEIIAEFLPPKHNSDKIVILCDGLPTLPNKKKLLKFFSKKGFWVFHLRYRGTWESGGEFLQNSPEQDVLDIIDELPKGFKDGWNGDKYKVNPKEVCVVGSSFGGATALMCARSDLVKKVVAFSPLVDWTEPSEEEPLDKFVEQIKNSFYNAYRSTDKNWQKLLTGKFFNPINHINEIDGKKVLVFHAKDDKIINFNPVQNFCKKIGATFILKKKGGHFSLSKLMRFGFWWKVRKFLK
ncbi:MAG: prolyl oligopeptidase family serine peptidase [Candidatus Magasanikbacteria bacterium]|nr:prolyl oligopeptidase family serine peptidase [Candidatus Magasanikbacteria bacterium]